MQNISTLWPHLAPFWPYFAPFGQCSPCTHVFASCVRVRARIFTKIFVWVFYYHTSLSLKFHTDPSICCGDIFSDTRYFKVLIRQGATFKTISFPNFPNLKLIRNIFKHFFKRFLKHFERSLKHLQISFKYPLYMLETCFKHIGAPLKHSWDTLETSLNYSWKHIWNIFETSLRHPWKILKTSFKHPWNILETSSKHSWNILEILFISLDALSDSTINSYTGCFIANTTKVFSYNFS